VTAVVAVSTFATLFNYSLANVSALRLDIEPRAYPRVIPILGLLLCLFLMLFFQAHLLAAGMICLLLGVLYYFASKR
jgi:APA family basic amino acid/polyamine antiporter